MTAQRPDGPTTGNLPTLTPDAIRAIQDFATHCDRKADRARALTRTLTWRTTARLARHYIREHS